jgi:hypothetical protein
MRRLLSLAGVAVVALSLASCGGDDAPKHPGTPENPLVAQPAESEALAGGRSNEAAAAPEEQEQAEPGFQALVDRQSSKPRSRFSPCNLVSQPRAGAILGKRVAQPVEAPQGPTCIYRSEDGDQFVTLAVQSLDFRAEKRQMQDVQELAVSSRSAYCGTLGQSTLHVRLSAGRVLTVGAPCPVAERFAAAAMRRLHS